MKYTEILDIFERFKSEENTKRVLSCNLENLKNISLAQYIEQLESKDGLVELHDYQVYLHKIRLYVNKYPDEINENDKVSIVLYEREIGFGENVSDTITSITDSTLDIYKSGMLEFSRDDLTSKDIDLKCAEQDMLMTQEKELLQDSNLKTLFTIGYNIDNEKSLQDIQVDCFYTVKYLSFDPEVRSYKIKYQD